MIDTSLPTIDLSKSYATTYSTLSVNGQSYNPAHGYANTVIYPTPPGVNLDAMQVALSKIQQRLAILDDPDPAKLEKYAALKKAYEQYTLLEKLIDSDQNYN